ncbi:hypothetical protein NKJ88_01440 [Mesorhizobium sp. M0016]|uniref:hypothetical protein n=1 Tax=Mesorhizobium sp. M0016 TaxID=2956843 RepID=UPI003339A8B2
MQVGEIARRYEVKRNWIAGVAIIPIVNFFVAIWALRLVRRLKPLVASGEPHYVRVGGHVRWMMLAASSLSIVAGVAVVTDPIVSATLQIVDEIWLLMAGMSYFVALVLFIASLSAALLLRPAATTR